MENVLIIRYGEIMLKGDNKSFFEAKLTKHIRGAVKDLGDVKVYKMHSRVYIDVEDFNADEIIERVKKVFGVVCISPAVRFPVDFDVIKETALNQIKEEMAQRGVKTFKVESKRVDKKFPLKSPEMSREIGGYILENTEGLEVDVHNPEVRVYVEVRECSFVFTKKVYGFGGLPLGTNGKALLLLSGGIDSPVAGWLVAKRGVEIHGMHFHSYPFTSERAKEKVVDLAKILTTYCGRIKLYSVNLLAIQKEINEKCPEEEMTILSRRFMMKIAERVANKIGCDALVTGESIGQVASQTVKGLHVTNAAVELPVFRPLIAMDKVDIMDLARKIDTYETSILPFEDCCTVFLPKRPVTQPRLEKILRSEALLDVEGLIESAIGDMEVERISLDDE
ncbi:thiamine biosynthesis/tRNA modification protein ThiI [Alkaliphilus metalliredigens QYMF]|uniref:Probable tRNA sulfurtransferase n=1 Tax=Alkaliphilus metalliredigens (strain QYMF) TaxID=293826 RepID=THII_ALKMQ|nr:tRNA uracil 4-sulfurtransferase ThiI [Alkaliphilus metalliredigens]A6TQ96.1 RecName: Full=Probable tRNA sulfurtransferase; AltName: Full=Sulfur carrier protein ThiS sulfurtransferase; AltName: Full=Thiamine biosynthesis protein ThiI; AltName: Full=tRNA 4-thiouridine synthase [Alkaliphilus metalliredigens QYMF]ABR48364.1 thiamine biosynthesis/tRNA modification protein ThiI [Alkaliphilus metalliredigens QYMF]